MTVTKTHFACGFDRWDEFGLRPPQPKSDLSDFGQLECRIRLNPGKTGSRPPSLL
jgi:hypothetical protein